MNQQSSYLNEKPFEMQWAFLCVTILSTLSFFDKILLKFKVQFIVFVVRNPRE